MSRSLIFAIAAAALLLAPAVQATLVDHHAAATAGADHLLEVQLDSGAMPWLVGSPGEYQNVQGITAIALLDAYTLTLDTAYLDGATATFEWLVDYHNADEENLLSSGNYFFMAKYGLLQLDLFGDGQALATANEAFERLMDARGGPAAYAETILEARVTQGHTNLGLWDVGLFARAANDIGNTAAADAFAGVIEDQVATQAIVDPFDTSANWYEIGLTGLLFGLAESDAVSHQAIISEAAQLIKLSQCGDGSFAYTWQGEQGCGSTQHTAYAVLGLTYALHLAPEAQEGCDFLASTQAENGGWDLGGYEIAEVDAEAVGALVQCALPLHNGVTAYANDLVPGL